ncbi:MAG: hypothetical protein QW182_07730, partial [Thermosphaera sp.]
MMKMFEPYLKAINELIRKYVSRSEGYTFNPKITIHEALRAIDIKRSLNGRRGAISSQQREVTNTVDVDSPKI